MVFKKGVRTSSANLRNNGGPVLVMECWEDSLSPSQVAAFKQKVLECQRAQEKVGGQIYTDKTYTVKILHLKW